MNAQDRIESSRATVCQECGRIRKTFPDYLLHKYSKECNNNHTTIPTSTNETEGGGSVPPKNECRGPQWEFVGLMPGPDRRRFDHYPPPGIDSGAMDHRPPTRTYIFVRRWGSSSGPIAMVEVRLGGGARRRRLLCVVWDGWRWRKKKRGLCLWALF